MECRDDARLAKVFADSKVFAHVTVARTGLRIQREYEFHFSGWTLDRDVDVHAELVQVEPANDAGITSLHGEARDVFEANTYGDAMVHTKVIDGQAHTARISKCDALEVSRLLHWIQANHASEFPVPPATSFEPMGRWADQHNVLVPMLDAAL
jgi:hypothetical protein